MACMRDALLQLLLLCSCAASAATTTDRESCAAPECAPADDDRSALLQMRNAASQQTSAKAAARHWARQTCEKNLWMTMDTCMQELSDNTTYVITGDIDAMWTRDSTAQLWPYLVILERHLNDDAAPKTGEDAMALQHLQRLLTGALRRQAKFLLTDPYANAYTDDWNSATWERLNRGGYVFTGNFEVDSGVYFMRFFTRLAELELKQRGPAAGAAEAAREPGLWESANDPHNPGYSVIGDPTFRSAVTMLVALYRQERDHALGKSEHRYPQSEPWELPGPHGEGSPANWTGMVWGAFRPSDDPQKYAYNIPNNLFLASALGPLRALAEQHWEGSERLAEAMGDLRGSILDGVHKFGTAKLSDVGLGAQGADSDVVYCYETDGLGNCLLMDDANVPSLLSLPYLDPTRSVFDEQIYATTRRFVLSEHDPWFFNGSAGSGEGSPHTGADQIWPLAMVMQLLTSTDPGEKEGVLTNLYKVQEGSPAHNGLSESFNKDNAARITRTWFAWPNALFAEYLMGKEPSLCSPSLDGLREHLPKTVRVAKTKGPLEEVGAEFYLAPIEKIRRLGVVLPAPEYFP